MLIQDKRPDAFKIPSGLIKTWSYSALKTYDSCPQKLYHSRIKGIYPSTESESLIEGKRIHKLAEDYLNKDIEFPQELSKLKKDFDDIIRFPISSEDKWAFTRTWQPCEFKDKEAWLRLVCDAVVYDDPDDCTSLRIIDFKTGKKFGNEFQHNMQIQLYAIAAFSRFPNLEWVTGEVWYTKTGDVLEQDFQRQQTMRMKDLWNTRAVLMTGDNQLLPKPNKGICGHCDYAEVCEWSAV